jgi:8-oxo-dGTP diphosphatase
MTLPRPARRKRVRDGSAAATLPLDDAEPTARLVSLTTERLTLRPLTAADAEALHRLVNDFEVTRNLTVVPFPYPRDLADDWIAATARELADGSAYQVAVTGHEGAEEVLVGVVGVRLDADLRSSDGHHREAHSAARIGRMGYWVGRRFWGHGVATEAAGRLARWALANLSIDQLVAEVATDNPASAAVLRRIGFRQVGEGVTAFRSRGGQHPVWQFQATRDDIFGHTEIEPAAAPGSKPLLLVAACALIDIDGRVLLARRPEGKKMAGLWEFPGGKLNPGETPEAALIRELKEELGIDVSAACLAPFAFASHAYDRFHLLMPLYLCRRWKGIPRAREGQTLSWVRPARLADYEMPPADKPLVPLLREFL